MVENVAIKKIHSGKMEMSSLSLVSRTNFGPCGTCYSSIVDSFFLKKTDFDFDLESVPGLFVGLDYLREVSSSICMIRL